MHLVWLFEISLLLIGLVLVPTTHSILVDCNEDNHDIDVTKMEIDSDVRQIIWINLQTVYLRTSLGTVYRSSNGGVSWSIVHTFGGVPIRFIYKTGQELESLVFLGPTTEVWTSENGISINRATEEPNIRIITSISKHPVENDWLLVAGDSNGCGSGVSSACYRELLLSKTLGKSWVTIATHVYQYSWGNAGQQDSDDPSDTVYISSWENAKGKNQNELNPWDAILYKNVINGDRTQLKTNAVAFAYTDHKILWIGGPKGKNDRSSLRLYVSLDGGRTLSLTDFPYSVDQLEQNGYTILDSSEGTTFVNVMHGNSEWGHLYSSDVADKEFSLSLDFNHRTLFGAVDFEKVEGLSGVYVGNQMEDSGDGQVVSRITWDKGGEWSPLNAPDNSVGCTAGKDGCNLHLYGKAGRTYLPVYTMGSAVGLIIGLGNVGNYLGEHPVGTYLSRDAGVTWTRIAGHSSTYEFGDHGGIMVLAQNTFPTNKFQFSWNEGLTLTTCQFSDIDTSIYNIMSGGGPAYATSQDFIMFGRESTGKSIVFHLNFTSLHKRHCQGPDTPNNPSSDYELWSPTPYSGNECLLGRKEFFVRRKPFAECYNGEEFEREVTVENCACSIEDYTCDYCFEEVEEDHTCELSKECEDAGYDPATNCTIGEDFLLTQGYRLVVGDSCLIDDPNALDLRPNPATCTRRSSSSSSSSLVFWIFFGVLLGLLGVAIAGAAVIAVYYVSKRIKEQAPIRPYEVLYPAPTQHDHLPDDDDDDDVL